MASLNTGVFSSKKSNKEDSFNDLYSFLTSKNLLRSLPHKKSKKKLEIAKLNNDIDLYTMQKIDDPSNSKYHIDHIFELQCFAYIVASALHKIDGDRHGRDTFAKVKESLVKLINSNFNLNVTDNQANLVKMNIFKEFIRRRRNDSSISIVALLRNTHNFNKNIYHLCSTLRLVCKQIRDQLRFYSSDSLYANYQTIYNNILVEFDSFYNSMMIEEYDLLRYF
jgi:hypothetical protein